MYNTLKTWAYEDYGILMYNGLFLISLFHHILKLLHLSIHIWNWRLEKHKNEKKLFRKIYRTRVKFDCPKIKRESNIAHNNKQKIKHVCTTHSAFTVVFCKHRFHAFHIFQCLDVNATYMQTGLISVKRINKYIKNYQQINKNKGLLVILPVYYVSV